MSTYATSVFGSKMTRSVFALVFVLLDYVASAPTVSEIVWLKDVTTGDKANTRSLEDNQLPDQLTFHLKRRSGAMTLTLKRNYDIDPNADIYVVQEMKNGRPIVTKTNISEEVAVAYYQDIKNMAFMTVRCVARSYHKCDRVINGNVRIGDSNYHIRPEESDFASGQTSEIPSVIEKRYFLLDQANVEKKDATNTRATNIEEELYAGLRPFRRGEKQNHFLLLEATLPRYIVHLQDKMVKETARQQRHDYYVKVAVLIDSGVYDLYASSVQSADPLRKSEQVRQKIREAYSHIINGVNLRFKTIDDPSISITVILQHFTVFQREILFPHKNSKVVTENGKKYIDAHPYSRDLKRWVQKFGINLVPEFDHAMLFTGYEMYRGSTDKTDISGVSPVAGVCDEVERVSLIQLRHYSRTVLAASHELGHNLGAQHDGTADARYCNPDERFIMYHRSIYVNATTPYSRNAWIFSKCSMESFKKTLISKECVKDQGLAYDTDEWMLFMKKTPGDVFTPNMQCYIIFGPHYVHHGVMDENICHRLTCRNLKTRDIWRRYLYAADGTKCGKNMWCIEGMCVSKGSKKVVVDHRVGLPVV